jgi:hypothetical protein
MQWQQIILDMYKRTQEETEKVLDGLTVADLYQRPSPGANPIGWLVWHTARSMDRTIGDAILGQQLWISEGWHKKFGMPPDPMNTGRGNTDAQVDAFKTPDVQMLLDYYHAVMKVLVNYVEHLTEDELGKEHLSLVPPGTMVPFARRIISITHDNQYIGQAAYARGIIKGQGWYGR